MLYRTLLVLAETTYLLCHSPLARPAPHTCVEFTDVSLARPRWAIKLFICY